MFYGIFFHVIQRLQRLVKCDTIKFAILIPVLVLHFGSCLQAHMNHTTTNKVISVEGYLLAAGVSSTNQACLGKNNIK